MTAQQDALTGLRSRHTFTEDLTHMIAGSDGVALALIDIDHFKEVNDTYGHERGDKLLRELGSLLGESAGPGAFRMGGDEFALALANVTLEQAFLKMEALRMRVAEQELAKLPSGERVTITIGVAHQPRDARDARELLAAAGAALASAKEAGRNQVCLPPTEKMVMKSCYYSAGSLGKLRALAEQLDRKESRLLREALDDLLRKYDTLGAG
jgi:diguanylate cyclase (GGDEF)-like protein